MASENKSDTDHLLTEQEFCGTVATSALLYDHSYITRFPLPNINSRNTEITPQRYSQLQKDITNAIQSNTNHHHIDDDESDRNLTQLNQDIQKAFNDNSDGYQYPDSNPIHEINIDSKHKKMAKFNTNSKNKNNPNSLPLHNLQQILSLPRSAVMMDEEEKTMDIDQDTSTNSSSVNVSLRRMSLDFNETKTNHNKPSKRNKITPLKRKLTEIIIDEEESSPYKTPKPNKRRKLTHRQSSMTLSQTPFLQRSMSLSQGSLDLSQNQQCSVVDNIKNVESHLNTFYGRFRECVEDVPLGYIDMERATASDQMSWMTVRFNIESLAKCHKIQSIQTHILSNLLYLIDKQLCSAMDYKLINPPHIPFQSDVDNVAKGIEAAIIALYIMTAKDIHRSLIQEDVLCKILKLITFQISNNFAPIKDEEQRTEYKEYFNTKTHKKSTKKRRKTKKKQKKKGKDEEDAFWKDLNTQMNALYSAFCSSLLLLMNIYTEKEIVREQQITELLNCCFNTFDIENIDDIQDGCKSMVITIFVKYEEDRNDIINRIMDYYQTERTYFAKRKITESKDKETNYIHLINMLILEICQCLSSKMLINHWDKLREIQLMNTPHRIIKKEKEITENRKSELFKECIILPMTVCKHILNNIIKGIVKIVIDTKNGGNRLVMFYKDLENVWDLTQYPIAEYALTVTLGAFHSFLTSKHMDNKEFKGVRGYFIAGLSSICATARLAKKIGSKNKIHCTSKLELNGSSLNTSSLASNPLNMDERIDCKCGQNKKTEELKSIFMIDCDDCHSWSHGHCVGIQCKEEIPQQWICDFCQINREIQHQLLQINAKHADNKQIYDESTKLHILLINYLSKELANINSWYIPLLSSHSLSARQFHLIQWLYWKNKESEEEEISKCILTLFFDYFVVPLQSQLKCLPTFSDIGIHRVNMQLALHRRLIALHDTMIYFIASDLQNTLSKSRTKALKSLKEICDVDPSILSQQNIKDRVIEKFKDKSASVRESAVDLVGHYVIDNAALISVYFDDLAQRIMDNAVSVRKRVIRIFGDICLKSPSNPKYKAICLCLFNKMSEKNEGIKKLIASTFEEMWFKDKNILFNRVITKSNRGGNKTFSSSFKKLVQQIIDSISSINDDNEDIGQYLIDLIVKMLEKEDKKRSNRVFAICVDMVSVIMDKLMSYKSVHKEWMAIKPLIESLYIFCRVRPLFVSLHFVSLQSFIQSPPKAKEGAIYKSAIYVIKKLSQILTTIIPFIDKSAITKTSYHQTQKQMIRILWNSELSVDLIYDGVYTDIIQSLCCVIHHLSCDYKFIISNIFDLCIGALQSKQENVIWSKTNQFVGHFKLIRSLLFLGFGAKYFDINKYYNDQNMIHKIYEIYLFFLNNSDKEFHVFRQYAIQGFIPLFCREPSLMIKEETTSIIGYYLNDSGIVQTECLNALHQFFETEEKRTQFLQNKYIHKDIVESDDELSDIVDEDEVEMKRHTGINGDIVGIRNESYHDRSDTGDLIHFINILSPSITKLCSSQSSSVRNHCCQILLDWTTSLWSNPLEYLKQIIALSLDPNDEKTRNMALCALNKIIVRTPTLFNMNILNGIIQSFKLYHLSLNAMFIDEKTKINKIILENILPQNVHKLFAVLDSMNKSKKEEIIASITRSIISYMDFTVCIKKKICKKKNYLTIPIFITFLCHFLCFIPNLNAYSVIQSLDNILKNNLLQNCENLKEKMAQEMNLNNLKNLFEDLSKALMYLIICQFRSFWCKLYNLSDQNISLYKLTANKKKLKLKTNKEEMFFIINLKNKEEMIKELSHLYHKLFIQNIKTKEIPTLFIEIEKEFTNCANQYIQEHDFERYTQTDDDGDHEMKTKPKSKSKKKKEKKKRGRKKKKILYSTDEEDEEDFIVYDDTSPDDDDDDDDSDF